MRGVYPDLPGPRAHALLRDALTITLLACFVWLGLRVHHDVDRLAGLGTGVTDAGNAVKTGFSAAAQAASGIPLAGGAIASVLRGAANSTGGNIAAAGHAGAQSAHHLAVVLGLLIWGLPTLLLLARVLPKRIQEIQQIRGLRLALRGPDVQARRRLLALRATMMLPDRVLFAYTPDPAGDLLAGRYDRLAAAALEAGGLRANLSD